MHFMLQKEVVERMAAPPGNKVYGRLSVMLQAYCAVAPLFTVPPGAFRPAPKVDSAVVRLVPRGGRGRRHRRPRPLRRHRPRRLRPAPQDPAQRAFRHFDADAIAAAGLDPGARAERLSVADFIRRPTSRPL